MSVSRILTGPHVAHRLDIAVLNDQYTYLVINFK